MEFLDFSLMMVTLAWFVFLTGVIFVIEMRYSISCQPKTGEIIGRASGFLVFTHKGQFAGEVEIGRTSGFLVFVGEVEA